MGETKKDLKKIIENVEARERFKDSVEGLVSVFVEVGKSHGLDLLTVTRKFRPFLGDRLEASEREIVMMELLLEHLWIYHKLDSREVGDD